MKRNDVKEILEKQLQLLSEQSDKTTRIDELCRISIVMAKIVKCLRLLL